MANKGVQTSSRRTAGPDAVIRVLDSLLADSKQKRLTGGQATVILDALASSDDPALVVQFPVVLSICARNGIALDSHALFSKYWESSPKKQNLEKLLLVSEQLFSLEGIEAPQNLKKIASSLQAKHGDLVSDSMLPMSSGISIPISAIQRTLRDYAHKVKQAAPALPQKDLQPENTRIDLDRSADLEASLDRLFSPKQKELVYKKLRGEPFTKTDREYYSRVVRKKLQAIANAQVSYIANKLTQKKPDLKTASGKCLKCLR